MMWTSVSKLRFAWPAAALAMALTIALPARAQVPSAAGLWQKTEDGKPVVWFLIVDHHDKGVVARPVKHRVGAERSLDMDTGTARGVERGRDDADFLVSEHPILAGMRIETRDGDAG